ncbi:MAG: hypothetical protein KME47_09950 [Nodosilinea sp. WJT8-NPBG4]|jgi:hypothetical protein|nr:hypothetical protein [Nodosilinea sp. WJT8-NPBG4]
MLSPNYYAGWNFAISQLSVDRVSRKAFVKGLSDSIQVEEYSAHGSDYYKGLSDAVATYQANRKIPIKAEIKVVSFFS